MVVVITIDDINHQLATIVAELNYCGFKTRVVERKYIENKKEKVVVLGRHPKRNYNGKNSRRRFCLYRDKGIIKLVEGAPLDVLLWRDLYCKLFIAMKAIRPEQKFFLSLNRLRERKFKELF